MKSLPRILFTLGFVLSPLPFLFLFGVFEYLSMDILYGLSMCFGISSLVYMVNHVFLSTKPWNIDQKLGQAWYQAFHGILALVIVIMVIIHRTLKINILQYSENFQTLLGVIALVGILLSIGIAVFIMYPGAIGKLKIIKDLRSNLSKNIGFTYKIGRLFHSSMIGFTALAMIHGFLAGSSSSVPLGWLAFSIWALSSYAFYIAWRIRGRKNPVSSKGAKA